MKRLIVAADDFGLTEGINRGIAVASRDGIVTAASLMVNGTAFDSAIHVAKGLPELDLGLHLNLTEGQPVSASESIPTLADKHGFLHRSPFQLAKATVLGRVRTSDLEREIRAQIEKALTGHISISHIDGHKHVHGIPAVRKILSSVGPNYGIRGIRSLLERVPGLLLLGKRNGWRKVLKQRIASVVAGAGAKSPGSASPQSFYGITQTGFLDMSALADIINDLNDGTHELMCHPGYVDDDLKRTPTRLLNQRERELELLTSPEARRLIKDAGVTLATYRDLLENHGNR